MRVNQVHALKVWLNLSNSATHSPLPLSIRVLFSCANCRPSFETKSHNNISHDLTSDNIACVHTIIMQGHTGLSIAHSTVLSTLSGMPTKLRLGLLGFLVFDQRKVASQLFAPHKTAPNLMVDPLDNLRCPAHQNPLTSQPRLPGPSVV